MLKKLYFILNICIMQNLKHVAKAKIFKNRLNQHFIFRIQIRVTKKMHQ